MKNKRLSRKDKKEIKVTYISSPVKVKTNASNFRALVQELTGQDSNVAEITSMPLDSNGNSDHDDEKMHRGLIASTQQWRVDVPVQGYLNEAALLKPADYSDFLSRSLVQPLNQHFQCDLLSFDMS